MITPHLQYYVQYPISLDCALQCPYCFHSADRGKPWQRGFTIEQYAAWRDKHMQGADRILITFHGGEPSIPRNMDDIVDVLSKTTVEHVEILTNGLGNTDQYRRLLPYANRVDRIICTYHRTVLDPGQRLRFNMAVCWMQMMDLPVVVKELLIHNDYDEVIANQRQWRDRDVDVLVADFRGMDRGRSFEEWGKYDYNDHQLISPEFRHFGPRCHCNQGYRNVIIRGGWFHPGDVLACWEDAKCVGSIQDGTYNPDHYVSKNEITGEVQVVGEGTYQGTYHHDVYHPGVDK